MVGSHSRPSPSPGPGWEAIQEPENTPEVSSQDELERESVLEELLPAAVLRKRKEQAVSHEASVKRPRIGANGFSRGRDIPSSIQITPRQRLSPGITRRVGENFALTSREKIKSAENRYAAKNGSVENSSIPRDKVSSSGTSSSHPASNSGTSISAPHFARKRTKVAARKSASDYPRRVQSLHVSSAFTRKLKRTREEKKRQNSEDDSSDLERFLPMSPSLPPPSGKTAKGADNLANKAPNSSTRGKPSVSQPLPVAKQNPVEIIDITSDGESELPKTKMRKEKNHIPRDVLEILSDDNDEPEESSHNARVTSKAQSNSRLVIEILDSDDEPLSTPAILEEMREDEIMADVLAQRTMDVMDRLSLRGSQSPHDEPTFLPPESASEGSEIMESGAASGSSSNSISERAPTPQNIDVHSAHTGMDINEVSSIAMPVIDAVPSQKFNSPQPITSSATDNISVVPLTSPSLQFNNSLEPGGLCSPLASPTQKSSYGPMPDNGLNTQTRSAVITGDLPSFRHPLSPAQRSARQSAVRMTSVSSVENTPSKKERPLSGDTRRKNNAFNSPSLFKKLPSPSNKLPPETPMDRVIRDPLSPTALRPLKRWSLGMNLADAITQASQDNNNRKLPIRTYSEADATVKVHLEASQEAIEKSKLFLEMVQMSIPERSHVAPVKLDLPLNESRTQGTEYQCPPDPASQGIIGSPVDLEPSVTSAQNGPDFDRLELQEMDMREVAGDPAQEDCSPPPSSAAIHERRSKSSETTADDDKMIESSDELEYIDEPEHNTVVQGIAGIDITDRGLGSTALIDEDALILDGHHEHGIVDKIGEPELSSSTTIDTLNGIVSTPATSPGRTYKPNSISSSTCKHGAKIDGFTIINWREFRHDIKNFTPKYCLGRDLPHTLQDYINHMSEWTRSLPDMRTVFTAAIQENTALDEPDAPPILMENSIDDEPTPPWEFHYSNQMWHGEGVPPPDIENLISCDCIGRCDPRSKTCACALRQQQALHCQNADFAYDNKGRLKEPGYPIFECNDLCGCDDDCRNRVVQHGRTCAISIKKTEYKGWGVFADQKKIYKGTYIGIYAGELITDEEGEERGRLYNKLGRTYLFDIDFHHLRKDRDDWQSKYTVDAYHAGNFTRFLNHSCDPNCTLIPCYINEGNIEKPLLAVFARREIEIGEELCFSYSGDVDDEDDLDGAASDDEANEKNDAVYAQCHCGAKNCKGRLFG